MKILVVYWDLFGGVRMQGVHEHLYALEKAFPEHDYFYWDGYFGVPSWISKGNFSAVIIHNTFFCLREMFDLPVLFERTRVIKKMSCPKIAIPQDEYDQPHLLDEWFEFMGVSTILSNFPQYKTTLYPKMSGRADFVKVYTGYISNDLLRFSNKDNKKKWDVGYRASRLPFWFGSLGQFKYRLGEEVSPELEKYGLTVNCSTKAKDFFIGKDWYSFLSSSKSVLGSESGSSILIKNKRAKADVIKYLADHPKASFDEVNQNVMSGEDGMLYFSTLSPRHFECAALRVCQLLVEGEYDGVLKPDIHYIPIKKDFSNLSEVAEKLKDDSFCNMVIKNAYDDLACDPKFSYEAFSTIVIESVLKNSPEVVSAHRGWNRRLRLLSHFNFVVNRFRKERVVAKVGSIIRNNFPWLYSTLKKVLK